MADRHVYLKIETIEGYSPVDPQPKTAPPVRYKRDCMRFPGHEDGTIPDAEVEARALTALVYREYLDPGYLFPKVDKLIEADVNEPLYRYRVPGTVIYAHPGERLHVHVQNDDAVGHSLHVHGLDFGIESDGAWPFGTQAGDGRRSDEICPGQSWTYVFDVTDEMVGAWAFHDHAQMPGPSIARGLFGGIVVLPKGVDPPESSTCPDPFKRFRAQLLDRAEPRFRLAREERVLLGDHLEFLDEYLGREQILPVDPPEVHHVPVFLHLLAAAEAKPLFDSGDLEENVGVFEHVFAAEGSFDYFCQFHPTMQGTVEVVAGGPATATVNMVDAPAMAFSPDTVTVGPGGTVRWENHSVQHHTVTSRDGATIPTHCINGRGFVGCTPTVVADSGQTLRWYVFNLDLGHEFHNFHPHSQRWVFAGGNYDVRSLSPAESFVLETTVPDVMVLPPEIEKLQRSKKRPKSARCYRLKGDFVFHCHVHHHMMNGMIGVVRARQEVWLTPEMKEELEKTRGLPLDDGSNLCPEVDPNRCRKLGEGRWDEVPGDPEVTHMHSVLLPGTEKVLYWGYTRADQSRLFDYSGDPGVYVTPANQPADLPGLTPQSSDLWSAEHAFLDTAEGKVLVHGGLTNGGSGGPTRSFLFDPVTEQWEEVAESADDRFYSTTLTLADGRLLTLFGSASKSIEVYDPGTDAWDAPNAVPGTMFHHRYYPWTYLLPDGRLFIAGPHVPTQRFDWNNPGGHEDFATLGGDRSSSGEKGTSVLLTLRPPSYEPRVIIAGGNLPGTEDTAEIIDLSQPAPAWSALPNLNRPRPQQFTATLLPDGRVLIAGGDFSGADGGPSEIFDPRDPGAGWELGPSMKHRRGYHSSFVLLADGSVLAGGDPQGAGGPTQHERYYPNYYDVPRPEITNAPASIQYAASFQVDTPQASDIAEVILMRPGAATHGFNMSQRAVECVISGAAAGSITVDAPPDGNVAPPGPYLLFVLDSALVPSEGVWIRLTT